jgi:RHS repeat-associated protein
MSNPVGRLVVAYAPTSSDDASEVFSYDPMGRVILHAQAGALDYGKSGNSSAYLVNYTYDLAGNLTSEATNGWEFPTSGVTLSYAYNSASQPTSVTSNLVDSNHPSPLATVDPSVGYYPAGELRKIAYGNTLTGATAFNKDLQPCRINLNSSAATLSTCTDPVPSGNLLDHNYGFNAGTSDNGNVASWTATGQQAFNRTYTYDTLNRLGTMSDSNSGQPCRGLSWTDDAWGNRTDQTNTAGTCPTFHQTVNTQNRLVGPPYLYDAAGNMTYDGAHTYTYDAENRITQVDSGTTASYVYSPEGRRVTKISGGSTRDYVYDLSSSVIAEMTSSGWQVGNVYLGGQMIAEYKNSTTYFVHQDHLGSTRLVTGLNQAPVQNLDYFPYGELNSTNSGITTHEFTGDERDAESGLDHTQFRQYSSSMARWMTPDPAGLGAVDPTNPQSWNRYAYVLNSPLLFVDSQGLIWACTTVAGVESCTYYPDDQDTLGMGSPTGGLADGGGGGNPDAPALSCTGFVAASCVPRAPFLPSVNPCANSTLSATGVNIYEQLKTVKGATAFPASARDPASSLMFGLLNFGLLVHTGGPFDVKNQVGPGTQQQKVAAGNIAYGATCPFGARFCQFAAGAAQTMSGSPDFTGTLLTGFDTPADNDSIRVGQAMRAAGCHE